MSEATRDQAFSVGDVLRVSCPSAKAHVAEVSQFYVSIEWPWAKVDPNSAIEWNGRVAIPRNKDSHEWAVGLFRTAPEPWHLEAGDTCHVGIPERLVRVIDIGHYDPPADVGWLPRPHTMLIVLPADHAHDPVRDDDGETIDLESAAPIKIELVSRG
ncbi:hypothetical protein [Streptomyces sp. V1I6]|uniref:hypothetical protein n=1 Tax=Streptomyces sp. V1I6 TaxID=3042273 RepID=UPI002780BE8A|nr:hypothetical protein [Streptomyces sp. V1I6]MDQ0844049.1 hypothetical protein [Streptomyces sp. V1I6]